jgi:hypothetical protein
MSDKWVDDLIKQRQAQIDQRQQSEKLQAAQDAGAAVDAFNRFCTALEAAANLFGQKNSDQQSEQFRCEKTSDTTFVVIRRFNNEDDGKIEVSLNSDRFALDVLLDLNKQNGINISEPIELFQAPDGKMYFRRQDKQVSTTNAAQDVFSTFILRITD